MNMDEQIQTEENQSERQLTKKERRQMRREEKKMAAEHATKSKGVKNSLVWVVVFILVAAAGFGIYRYLFSGAEGEPVVFDPTSSCVTHAGGGMHIHPELSIDINGERQEISSNIGVSPGCMRPLHTHDATGKLHIEFPREYDFTLGEFFKVWGKQFSGSQIFDYATDETNAISMTVNGEESLDYENLILNDADSIEIKYESISE